MTSERAAKILRAHGIAAWPTTNATVVLVMDVSTERCPGGVVMRAEPMLLDTIDLRWWLGY